jgi:predicted GNAT superfamily acetyltransferase
MNPPSGITIRPLTTLAEMQQCEAVERAVWQTEEHTLPPDLLLVFAHNGGLVLGAWDGATLVGILVSFLGRTAAGRPKHCSHLLGVLPSYGGRGVARALKWAQRAAVQAQGLDLITWTFDPLAAPNARLNLHALGAICRTYHPDLYGAMPDGLNAGLPSDRFLAEWWLDSPRVADHARHTPLGPPLLPPPANPPRPAPSPGDWPQPGGWGVPAGARRSAVVAPAEFAALRADDPALALAWRLHTREVFTALFAAGYAAHDVVLLPERRELVYLVSLLDFDLPPGTRNA